MIKLPIWARNSRTKNKQLNKDGTDTTNSRGGKHPRKRANRLGRTGDEKQEVTDASSAKVRKAKGNKLKAPGKEKKTASTEDNQGEIIHRVTSLQNVVPVTATTPPPGQHHDGATTPPNRNNSPRKNHAQQCSANDSASASAPTSMKAGAVAEKWVGVEVARCWMDKADFSRAKSDFESINSITINVEKECKRWKANSKLNWSEEYPALDANLVKVENEYVNMSVIDVPLKRSVLIGQIPVSGSEETFWKVIFDKRVTCIHLLVGTEPVEFFPQKAEEYKYHGQMWVNNRRVEFVNDDVYRFLIEVLPNGCSNSIMCTVTLIKNWIIDSVHAKHSVVIKETIELTNFLIQSPSEENSLIISKHGAGRAGYFLALTVAVHKMDSKMEPSIFEIVRSIRLQRPKAVESFTQYASLYISMFYFIKRKASKSCDGDKKAASNSSDPLCKKSVELTQLFAKSLLAESNTNSAMSYVGKNAAGSAHT